VLHENVTEGDEARKGEVLPGAPARGASDDAFLRAVLRVIPAFVLRLDPEQRVRYVNRLRAGVTSGQVIGRPVSDFIAAEDLSAYELAIGEALRTGEPSAYRAKSSGALAEGPSYFEGHAVPFEEADGRRAVCVVASDVSEHVARAEALQRSEEKLRVAVEATGIGLWTWDAASDVVVWDERMVQIAGQRVESSREYLERVVHPDDRALIAGKLDAPDGARGDFQMHRIVRPDGEVRWVLPCGAVTRDEAGRALRITGGTLDVTMQRMTDEHLRRAQKLDAVGSLASGVAHNFNNMLAVIVPSLELALRGATEEQTRMLGDALYAARRAADLVAQLMTFSGQRRPVGVAPHDLSPVVARAASMCARTFERRVRVETMFDAGCPAVSCDPTAIEQVVVNLLINARDAVLAVKRAEPRILVTLGEVDRAGGNARGPADERYVCIRVEDNGVGMTDAVKQRAFEPFFSTKQAGKGTGLGLATSYGVVRDHGGQILIDSQPDVGTRVTVLLPAAREATVSEREEPLAARATSPGIVLVVDDEPAVRRVVVALLLDRGHEAREAVDGEAAIGVLDAGLRPDVILLDRNMPHWPAARTLEEIRRRLPRVPILFFTGQDVPAEERAQVQGVLRKPPSSAELVRAVERWLPDRARA
jgi:two-component system, cell cycle sensor histidine kinase and response regulator CckA